MPVLKCEDYTNGICSHNINDKQIDFLLWGDSHAFMFYDNIYELHNENKESWIYASCYPLFNVYIPSLLISL